MFEIKKAEFVTSVANKKNLPKDLPEFAFAGKSNVGKSSLINLLVNQSRLAIVSKTPGRTRLINLFLINDICYFVDLPGYGYAKSSKLQTQDFSELIEEYFNTTQKLKQLFILVDIRNGANEKDKNMISFCFINNIQFTIIATKCDKLSKSEANNKKRDLATDLKIGIDNIILSSSSSKMGKNEILQIVERKLKN